MKEFEVNLTNQGKAGYLALGFTIMLTVAMVSGIAILQEQSTLVTYAVLFIVGAGLFGVFAFCVKKVTIEPSLITIFGDRIMVLNRKSGNEQRLLFNDIASYKYSVYSGGKELRLKRKDSSTFKLSDKSEEFAAMVGVFESTLALYQQPGMASLLSVEKGRNNATGGPHTNGLPKITLREKTFFEKQISTVVMVVMSLVLILLTCSVFVSSRPIKGSLFLGYSGYFSYATTWWLSRKQRRK